MLLMYRFKNYTVCPDILLNLNYYKLYSIFKRKIKAFKLIQAVKIRHYYVEIVKNI